MTKRTKALQFDTRTKLKIIEREEGQCLFCKLRFHMKNKDNLAYQIKDIMHVVNKSQGGLGVVENGVLGCRYHHGLLDNGNRGLRQEMLQIIEDYMIKIYPCWNKDNLVYKK